MQPIRDAALAAVSSRWRDDPTQAFPFRNSAEIALTSLAQQVKVVASPQVTLTSRSGKVPVTLENDLGAAVDVSLVLTSLDQLAGQLRHRRHAAPSAPARRSRWRSR